MRKRVTLNVTPASDKVSASHVRDARAALARYFRTRSELQTPLAAVRWKFILTRVDRESDGTYYRLLVEPVDGVMRPDDRGRRVATYRVPPGAIRDFTTDERLVYRGIAWEEWQSIRASCFIRSRGTLNIDQDDWTFFGRAETALTYASDYAPLAFRPTKNRPAVIIAIRRSLATSHADEPGIVPVDEWAVRGSLSASAIVGVWYVVPTYIRQGILDVVVHRNGVVSDGRTSGPMQSYAIVAGDADDVAGRCRGPRESIQNGRLSKARRR